MLWDIGPSYESSFIRNSGEVHEQTPPAPEYCVSNVDGEARRDQKTIVTMMADKLFRETENEGWTHEKRW